LSSEDLWLWFGTATPSTEALRWDWHPRRFQLWVHRLRNSASLPSSRADYGWPPLQHASGLVECGMYFGSDANSRF
jgi:hypothetical protein